MACEFAGAAPVDELPEAIEETAFAVLDAVRQELVGEAERREFAHAMGSTVMPTPSSLISGAAS